MKFNMEGSINFIKFKSTKIPLTNDSLRGITFSGNWVETFARIDGRQIDGRQIDGRQKIRIRNKRIFIPSCI